MAAFLDVCRFTPSAGGAADWTYSFAVPGYQGPASANAVNGRVYKFRAESADLSQWELAEGAYNSSTTVFARTTVLYNSSGTGTLQSGAGTKINFSTVPQVAIVALKEDLISIEEANTFTATQRTQARANIAALLRGSKPFGLTLSTAGNSGSFTAQAGEAADSTGSDLMVLPSATTKNNAAWSLGSGQGGLDAGSFTVSTWYHVYLIKRPDTGVVDICYSTNSTAPTFGGNVPAAYTLYRRIGSLFAAGAGIAWTKFFQIGSIFYWDPYFQNVNAGTIGTTAVAQGVSTPPGIRTRATLLVTIVSSTAGDVMLVSPMDIAAQALGGGLANVGAVQASGQAAFTQIDVITNTSQQVRMVAFFASTTYYVWTAGWDDISLQLGI